MAYLALIIILNISASAPTPTWHSWRMGTGNIVFSVVWTVPNVQQMAPSPTHFSWAFSSIRCIQLSSYATPYHPPNVVQLSTGPYRLYKPFSDVGCHISSCLVVTLIFVRYPFSHILSIVYDYEPKSKDDRIVHDMHKYMELLTPGLGLGASLIMETFPFRMFTHAQYWPVVKS